MIALQFTGTKDFMSHLLLRDTFDSFSFIEGEITTFNTFKIDGYIQKEFYDKDALLPEYSPWKNIRDYCFSIIRGKRTPLGFRFVFSLSPQNTSRFIEQNHLAIQAEEVQGLYMNIHFDGVRLTCVTGTSFKTFNPDRTLEQTWDKITERFFLTKEISFEKM